MRKGNVDLAGEHLNFLRFSVDESAAATYTEKEIDTNLSAERGVMMEIHSIEVYNSEEVNLLEVGASSSESLAWHIARESKTVVTPLDNSDVIAFQNHIVVRSAAIGTDAGPLYWVWDMVQRIDFPRPIPYVKPSIFVALMGTDASAVGKIKGRIGYTLREIERTEFIELLVALQ